MPSIYNCNLKLLKHPDRIQQLRDTGDCFPINVEFHPTMDCNHQCLRCGIVINKLKDASGSFLEHTGSAGNHRVELPFDMSCDLIHGFAEVGVRAVTFLGGGEPLIYPGIHNLIDLARQHNMSCGVITNLDVDLDGNFALKHALSRMQFIRVSLDAACVGTHNLLHRPNRKKGAEGFERVLHNIRMLSDYREWDNPTIGVNFLIQEESIDEIPEAAKIVADAGADYIKYTPCHTDKSGAEYLPLMGRLTTAFAKAREVAQGTRLRVIPMDDRITSMIANDKDYHRCIWQSVRPVVGADGWLYPCCVLNYYESARIVNLRNYPCFKLAWLSPERASFMQKLDASKCPVCWLDEENRIGNYICNANVPHVDFA